MELSRYADLFLSESQAHISTINRHLLALERSGDVTEVEEIFRSAHTLKGMSSAMGCTAAAELAHALEHLLDQLRDGSVGLDESMMEVLFEGTDSLEQTIESELAGRGAPGEQPLTLARVRLMSGGSLDDAVTAAAPSVAASAAPAPVGEEQAQAGDLRVRVMIQAASALPAVRAMLVLRAARELGEVSAVVPTEEQLAAAEFSGTLAFVLNSDASPDAVRNALLRAGDVAHVEVEAVEPELDPSAANGAGFDPSALAEGGQARGEQFVRIGQQRLDSLLEYIGELVIARDHLHRLVKEREEPELDEAADAMSRLIGDVRDEVMGMRLAPIGDAFDRFPRFVRDAARSLRKKVDFEVVGRSTPLDRALHNELSDLLIHLLRNALDHGVETEQERAEQGKPPTAMVRLIAEREREQVVVRVEDDGRGIHRARVTEAAVKAGLLSAAEAGKLDDQDVYQLLTRPGFTTAREVTDVSGRGVGLDVVASRVRTLGGALEVESSPGEGTTFALRLPLSLAILRTLQVCVGDVDYVVPISAIDEVTEIDAGSAVAWQSELEGEFEFREERIQLLRLDRLLHPAAAAEAVGLHSPVLVLHHPEGPFGVVVDRLRGQHEAVLKPFDAPKQMIHVFAGATILSDGRPALILDALKLRAWVRRPTPAASARHSTDPSQPT